MYSQRWAQLSLEELREVSFSRFLLILLVNKELKDEVSF